MLPAMKRRPPPGLTNPGLSNPGLTRPGLTRPGVDDPTTDPRPLILDRMKRLDVSQGELSRLTGLKQPSIARTLSRGPSPAERALARLWAALDQIELERERVRKRG